ncbi:MAG: hypothetical protein ABR530_06140 [Pyrinomonadaceae bacterium]
MFAVLVFGVSSGAAQCREAGSIRLAREATTATVTGNVSAVRAVCYKFRAQAGQTLAAALTSSNGLVRFSIQPDAFDVDDEVTGDTTSWRGKLKGDYGDKYIVSIRTRRGTGRYTLTVTFK